MSPEPLLRVADLQIEVPGETGPVAAVRGVGFTLQRGESLGLVGESGSGKSLTCRAVLGVLPYGCHAAGGTITFDGHDLTRLPVLEWQRLRSVRIGAIFQDPASYLNPSLTIGRQLSEVLRVKGGLGRREAKARAHELLALVGLRRPELVYRQIPSELSGGMQQRAMLALAVSCDPDLLVADEPTTALDVKTQAEVLALLAELRERLGLAVLFVSHDLDVVAELCDRIAVFHRGEIVEAGTTDEIIRRPRHPYTRSLIEAAALAEATEEVLDGVHS